MGNSLDKINLRIKLLCKTFNTNFKVQYNNTNEVIYSFDNYKLGFLKIVLNTDSESKVETVSIYGNNESLFEIANQVEKSKSFFDLVVENLELSRVDLGNSILIIEFNKNFVNQFETFYNNDQDKYSKNIFQEQVKPYIPHKLAYNKRLSKYDDEIILFSKKFYRPRFGLNRFIEESKPDENGNVNCLYCIDCKNCKNCIGCFGCDGCEDCTNCVGCQDCRNCNDSNECINCEHCVNCVGCITCSFCDGLIDRGGLISCEPYSESTSGNSLSEYNYFPDSGSSIYHEKIESFFLINHFVPYHRSYENADNYNWNINWRISKNYRRYWITEETSSRYEIRVCTLTELSKFILLNKLQYQNWELKAYIKEYYNIRDIVEISTANELFEKILVPSKDSSQTYYDEIRTKSPNECIYNELLYYKK